MAVRAELFAQETLSGEIIVDNFAGGGGASSGIYVHHEVQTRLRVRR